MPNVYQELLTARRTQKYTEVSTQMKNNKIASSIKALASGKDSEMTAIAQYAYQHVILRLTYPEIAEALGLIAMNEMQHLNLLMVATQVFGGNPTFTNGQGSFWNARLVNYDNNIVKLLNENIKGEEKTIADYEKLKNKTDNQSLKTLLDEIIKDEKVHIEIFRQMLKDIQ